MFITPLALAVYYNKYTDEKNYQLYLSAQTVIDESFEDIDYLLNIQNINYLSSTNKINIKLYYVTLSEAYKNMQFDTSKDYIKQLSLQLRNMISKSAMVLVVDDTDTERVLYSVIDGKEEYNVYSEMKQERYMINYEQYMDNQ